MIKVIDVELTGEQWVQNTEGDTKYWTNKAIDKFIKDGWNIKDCRLGNHDIVLILQK